MPTLSVFSLPLSSVFTVFSLKKKTKKQKQKDGEKKPLKRTKRKKPSTKPTMDSVSIFFFFFFLICRWQEDGISSAQRILSLHVPCCPQPPGCQRLPDTRLRSPNATAPPSHHLTWLGGTFLHWSCSGSSQGLGRWPEALGGMDLLVRGRSRWVFVSWGPQEMSAVPTPHPEMKVTNFLCWAFASAPLSVRVPSLPPHRDLEEWGGEAVGLRVLVGVCVCISPLSPRTAGVLPACQANFSVLMPLTRTWELGSDLHVPQEGHRQSLPPPTPETVLGLWSPWCRDRIRGDYFQKASGSWVMN